MSRTKSIRNGFELRKSQIFNIMLNGDFVVFSKYNVSFIDCKTIIVIK